MAALAPFAFSPLVVDRIKTALLSTLSPTETVALDQELDSCYPGSDGTSPVAVTLDVTGTFVLPVGGQLVFEVHKLDPSTGAITHISSPGVVEQNGRATITIPAGTHGVRMGCEFFLLYAVAEYTTSTGTRRRVLLVKSFMICDRCPRIAKPGDTEVIAKKG